MTFSLPEALAAEFVRRVPPQERSRFLAKALAEKLKERERLLARACAVANRDWKVRGLERELDAWQDGILELY